MPLFIWKTIQHPHSKGGGGKRMILIGASCSQSCDKISDSHPDTSLFQLKVSTWRPGSVGLCCVGGLSGDMRREGSAGTVTGVRTGSAGSPGPTTGQLLVSFCLVASVGPYCLVFRDSDLDFYGNSPYFKCCQLVQMKHEAALCLAEGVGGTPFWVLVLWPQWSAPPGSSSPMSCFDV